MYELRISYDYCKDKERIIEDLVDQVHWSEHRNIQKRNEITATRNVVEEEVIKTARARSSLEKYRLVVTGISADVEAATDSIGNFISEELRALEKRVRGVTIQSLERFCESLRAASRTDYHGSHRSFTE